MAHTRSVALTAQADRYLFYDKSIIEEDNWPTDKFNKDLQFQGDLGERMSHAFRKVLANCDKAVIIGSDCPEIYPELIESAFDKLDFADAVVGPTLDGGYYLLGMKKHHSELFIDIPWSTEDVFPNTISRLREANLLYTVMDKLSDMDNINDLKKFPKYAEGIL